MNISDSVVPERFHPTTFDAGIPQFELTCYDPACMSEPGEACSPWCTHGEPDPAPGHEDLVPVDSGEFAVRHCPRCNGSGKDAASPAREDCRCRVEAMRELEMHAGALYRQARSQDGEQAARTLAKARRLDAEALITALTELDVAARVDLDSAPAYCVAIDTKFGRILAGLDHDAHRVLVRRVDGTQWSLRALLGSVRSVAWTLRDQVPELAREGDRLDWVVAIMPTIAPHAAVVYVGRDCPTGPSCPGCSQGDAVCPGLYTHMWDARKQYDGHPVIAVFGALPMPADSPRGNVKAWVATDEAIRPLAQLIWSGDLIIT